ncbi:MAG: acyl-CoA thioesterase [Sedimentisphaerales bacterium]|nr:acyl-CoA thioesterase [Sedimentisphaerales bacterium]
MDNNAANAGGQYRVFQDVRVVMPQHLNQYGSLFGGYLLGVIDEVAFIACIRRFPGRNFVTRAMDRVEFHAPAHLGDVVETRAEITRIGRTSIRVSVQACVEATGCEEKRLMFDGEVTMVCVDSLGNSSVLPSDGGGDSSAGGPAE